MDADVAALPDGGRLPQEPWQKRDIGGLRRLGAQGDPRSLQRERRDSASAEIFQTPSK
jgi:hypothetical protein